MFQKINQNPDLPRCIVCDIDGTIANLWDRSPYDLTKVLEDKPHWDMIHLITRLAPIKVIFYTGRSKECRNDTEKWLSDNFWMRLEDIILFMRKEGDKRKDDIIKYEMLQGISSMFKINYIFEDRDQVVQMAREAWFRVLQVSNGNF